MEELKLPDYGISHAHQFGSLRVCKLKGLYLGDKHLAELVRLLVKVEYLELENIWQLVRPKIQSPTLLHLHADSGSVRRMEVEAPKLKKCFVGGAREVVIDAEMLEDLILASGTSLLRVARVQKASITGLYWQTVNFLNCLVSLGSHLRELHLCPLATDEDGATEFSSLFTPLKELKDLEMNLNMLLLLEYSSYSSAVTPVLLKLKTLVVNLDGDYLLEVDAIAGLIRSLALRLPHVRVRLRSDDVKLKEDVELLVHQRD